MEAVVMALWFWELPRRDMGVWAPVYSGFFTYERGLPWLGSEEPISWVRIA